MFPHARYFSLLPVLHRTRSSFSTPSFTLSSFQVCVELLLLFLPSMSPCSCHLTISYLHFSSGEKIADWRNKGYQNDPSFGHFRDLLEAPKADAANLMKDRFPQPRYIECDQGSSPARFIYAVIDPDVGRGKYCFLLSFFLFCSYSFCRW
jgi:hypothetical protein